MRAVAHPRPPEDPDEVVINHETAQRLRKMRDQLAAPNPAAIDSPAHYTWHPLGHELTDIAGHFTFCLGNVLKYVWRAGRKAPDAIEDLKKARWYLDREIARLELGK